MRSVSDKKSTPLIILQLVLTRMDFARRDAVTYIILVTTTSDSIWVQRLHKDVVENNTRIIVDSYVCRLFVLRFVTSWNWVFVIKNYLSLSKVCFWRPILFLSKLISITPMHAIVISSLIISYHHVAACRLIFTSAFNNILPSYYSKCDGSLA